MNIGIDCRTILNPEHGERAGVGHYTYYLVKYLLQQDKKNSYVLFVDHRAPKLTEFKRRNVKIVRFAFSEYKRYLPLAYSHVFVSQFLNKAKLDVFHAPANTIPLRYHKPTVLTVHDLAIYDHPEWFPSKQDFAKKVLVPKSIQKAHRVIAVSDSTAQDIRKRFNIPKEKITTVYEGIEKITLPSKLQIHRTLKHWQLSEKYLLYVGTLEPRKNVAGIIEAFDRLAIQKPKRYKDLQLVIAGGKGYQFENNYTAIHNAKSGKIRYVGYVTAKEKLALMTGALAFLFPSYYEGFGLPVLEAMQCGTPVMTSKVSALPEVVGQAGKLVNPYSMKSIESAIDQLVGSATQRAALSKKGKVQAAKFSWKQCAAETLQVYQEVYAATR